MYGTLQFGKFKFVSDNPYNQITKLRGNCLMMQLALFCSSEKKDKGTVLCLDIYRSSRYAK